MNEPGSNGNCWSYAPNSQTNARNLNFNSGNVNPANNNERANGFSVRPCQERDEASPENLRLSPAFCFFFFSAMQFSRDMLYRMVDAAYRKTRLHERSKPRQLGYELEEEDITRRISSRLHARTWVPRPQLWFVLPGPPVREVFTSPFDDAVVSTLLFNILSPIAERYFIFDTYSCRTGKGTLFGVERFEHHLRSVTENWSRQAYVLSFDICGFFMSIIRQKLFDMIIDMLEQHSRRFPEDTDYRFARWLLETTLLRDPLEQCRYVGDPRLQGLVLPEKSIRFQPPGVGITIGAVDHQLDSTIYLTPMDNLVKRFLHIQGYSRYVDDGKAVHRSYAHLEEVARDLGGFLQDYGLRLHPTKTRITDAADGCVFLGAYVMPYRRHVRTPVFKRFADAMETLDNALATDPDLDPKVVLGPLNSRLGHMRQYKEYRRIRGVLERCPFIRQTYIFDNDLGRARLPDIVDFTREVFPLWTAA